MTMVTKAGLFVFLFIVSVLFWGMSVSLTAYITYKYAYNKGLEDMASYVVKSQDSETKHESDLFHELPGSTK